MSHFQRSIPIPCARTYHHLFLCKDWHQTLWNLWTSPNRHALHMDFSNPAPIAQTININKKKKKKWLLISCLTKRMLTVITFEATLRLVRCHVIRILSGCHLLVQLIVRMCEWVVNLYLEAFLPTRFSLRHTLDIFRSVCALTSKKNNLKNSKNQSLYIFWFYLPRIRK